MKAKRLQQRVLTLCLCLLLPAAAAKLVLAPPPADKPAAAEQARPGTVNPACPGSEDPGLLLQNCDPQIEPLTLRKTAATGLPAARLGQDYRYRFQASGGQAPYRFQALAGGLPEGLQLSADGELLGKSSQHGRFLFTLELRDQAGQVLRQRYRLNVLGPASPTARPPAPAPKPLPAKISQIETLPIAAAQTPLVPKGQLDTYLLSAKLVEAIKPAPPPAKEAAPEQNSAEAVAELHSTPIAQPAAPSTDSAAATAPLAGDAALAAPKPSPATPAKPGVDAAASNGLDELNDAAAAQLQQLLQPLIGVEFLNRDLFVAALDARVCSYAAELTDKQAIASRQSSPTAEQWRARCAVAWDAPLGKAAETASDAPVSWQDLPATLLPRKLRAWLVEQAKQARQLDSQAAPVWQGTGCNCLRSAEGRAVWRFAPAWQNTADSMPIDFSLYERIVGFAQPFDDDGNVLQPHPSEAQLAFFRAVHLYGSKLDLALYRGDWQFLQRLPDDHQQRIAEQVARQARRLLDTPLRQLGERWQDRIPGLAEAEYLGDGLTLYLDRLPTSGEPGYTVFDTFRHRLIQALITELRQSPRSYTLSLMLNGGDLLPELQSPDPARQAKGQASPAKQARWSIERLFDYLVMAEDPPFEDGRIRNENGGYRSQTNLTIQYLILLPEPSTRSKKVLRESIEGARALVGGNRAIFLRRLLPVVPLGSAEPQQFIDDMAYFNDNFGGVAYWPKPAADPTLQSLIDKTVRSTFLGAEPQENALCNAVCDWRWPLRALFWLLLGIAVLSLALFLLSCRIRALGRPYQLYLLLAGILPLVLGGLLLRCDPSLASADITNRLLTWVLVAVILSMLFPLLKPKVEKP